MIVWESGARGQCDWSGNGGNDDALGPDAEAAAAPAWAFNKCSRAKLIILLFHPASKLGIILFYHIQISRLPNSLIQIWTWFSTQDISVALLFSPFLPGWNAALAGMPIFESRIQLEPNGSTSLTKTIPSASGGHSVGLKMPNFVSVVIRWYPFPFFNLFLSCHLIGFLTWFCSYNSSKIMYVRRGNNMTWRENRDGGGCEHFKGQCFAPIIRSKINFTIEIMQRNGKAITKRKKKILARSNSISHRTFVDSIHWPWVK